MRNYNHIPFLFLILILTAWVLPVQAQSYETIKAQDNLYLVGDRSFSMFYITDSSVVVIDPFNSSQAQATMEAIRKVTDRPVSHVIYSHNHWDHIGGGEAFDNPDVMFISHRKAKQNIAPNSDIVMPDTTWSGPKNVLHIGGKTIELYYYGYNHGNGLTVFRFPKYKGVLIPDLVVPDRVLYAYLPDASPKNWVSDLIQIQQLNFEEVYFSHVCAIDDRSDVTLMQNYFDDLYAAVDSALKSDTPFFDIPWSVKLPQYNHLKNYDKWLHMNAWRILMEKSIGL